MHDLESFLAGWTYASADTKRLHRTAAEVRQKFEEWSRPKRPDPPFDATKFYRKDDTTYCIAHQKWPCKECGTSHYPGCQCPVCV
jgi:hypothetical protein